MFGRNTFQKASAKTGRLSLKGNNFRPDTEHIYKVSPKSKKMEGGWKNSPKMS